MPVAKIEFEKIVLDNQDYSSFTYDEDQMVSRIFFSIEIDGEIYSGLSVEICQPFCTDFQCDPLEIAIPKGKYSAGWDHSAFSVFCEAYYRYVTDKMVLNKMDSASTNIRKRNNMFAMPASCEIEVPEAHSCSTDFSC